MIIEYTKQYTDGAVAATSDRLITPMANNNASDLYNLQVQQKEREVNELNSRIQNRSRLMRYAQAINPLRLVTRFKNWNAEGSFKEDPLIGKQRRLERELSAAQANKPIIT